MGRIVTIIGTRPEIIKMAPVVKVLDASSHEHVLVHSGQHYDLIMDDVFFREMKVRAADHEFVLKAKPPHLQVAETMRHAAKVAAGADLVVVHGDTNTTLAGALLGNKLGKPVAHVEAGIRSFDKSMPEEVNRTLTDHVSSLLFAPTAVAQGNLRAENVTEGVHVVGNSVVDALLQHTKSAKARSSILRKLGLRAGGYFLLTFHRAENVDEQARLARALKAFGALWREFRTPIVFPVHPRTAKRIEEFGLEEDAAAIEGLRRTEPTGYLDMLQLEKGARLVLTDSGGLQEESCVFRVPCVTLRENTERPETLEIGANVLAGTEPKRVVAAVRRQLAVPRDWENPYGDGTAAQRIGEVVDAFLG